jgi:hypothetical protein
VIWILLGWGGLVTPRRAAYVIGGIGALFAASVTATQDWGLVLALAPLPRSRALGCCSASFCCWLWVRLAHC